MEGLSLSPWDWFQQAGPVGRAVLALLLVLSVACWLLIVEGVYMVVKLRQAVQAARGGDPHIMLAPILEAGKAALKQSVSGESIGEQRARIEQTMNRTGRALMRRFEGKLPNLAIISSVAPFIGLFGTVWGIMTSFAAIAAAKDTSLAVVAPGIAEALATTAFGLAAAIPASVGYTRLGAALRMSAAEIGDWIEETGASLVAHRDAIPKESD
jgi:biopolymer transport protein ExbB/TolQ